MFVSKNFSKFFSKLKRPDPLPVNKKLLPEAKLNPEKIIFFFIISKIRIDKIILF